MRYAVLIGMFLLLGAFVAWRETGGFAADSPAPDFSLPDAAGQTVRLSDFKGRPVVLAFWAVGCPPCRAEAPALSALASEYNDSVAVLAVNAWNESPMVVSEFARTNDLKQRILLGGAEVAAEYGVTAIPTVVWIDAEGRIRDRLVGAASEAELRQRTERLR